MGLTKTRPIKPKHAANKSGVSGSKAVRQGSSDAVPKTKARKQPKVKGVGLPLSRQVQPGKAAGLVRKKKRRHYTAEELGVPDLNMITPLGVVRPKGKKKGKIFVDDTESMSTILALVQAQKDGQIESKMIKARQMEEIREARRLEAEKRDDVKKAELESTKKDFRNKRKRKVFADDQDDNIKDLVSRGSKAQKASHRKPSATGDNSNEESKLGFKKAKRVAFADNA